MATTTIRLRRDSDGAWQSRNPILALGEPGWSTTSNRMKLGNGTSRWNSLPYLYGNDSDHKRSNDSDIRTLRRTDSDLRTLIYANRLEEGKKWKTIYIDPNGFDSDSDWGRRSTKPYKTFGQAAKVIAQGTVVQINNGIYAETLLATNANFHRNTSWSAVNTSGSGSLTQINAITSTVTGIKFSGLRVNNASSFNNTETTTTGNHYNQMLFAGTTTFNGTGFHEWHNSKLSATSTWSGTGGKYFYEGQLEATLTLTGSAGMATFIANSSTVSVTASGAGSFVVMKDCTAGTNSVITIGAGVVYSLQNCSGYTLNINASAVPIETYYTSVGTPASTAEALASDYFDLIKTARLKTKTLAARNKAKVMMQDSDTLVLKQMTLTTKHLTNVSDSDARKNQILSWDSDQNLWRPKTLNGFDSDIQLNSLKDVDITPAAINQIDSDIIVIKDSTFNLDGEYVRTATAKGLAQSNDVWNVFGAGAERYFYNASKSRSIVEVSNTNYWKIYVGDWGLSVIGSNVTGNLINTSLGIDDVNDLTTAPYEPVGTLVSQAGSGTSAYKVLSALGLQDGMILVWSANRSKWVNTLPDPGLDLGEF
jgi:hypothetical protein